jgi:DNA end-binding protein Ku
MPVRLYKATDSTEDVSFHQIHEACKGQVNHQKWCAACAREVLHAEIVKGYEVKKGEHIVIAQTELDAIADAASSVLDITAVVNEPIDPLMIDSTALLVPDGPAAAPAFHTLRLALKGRKAIGSMVLRNREVRVALSGGNAHGFVVYVLRGTEQVRNMADLTTSGAAALPDKASIKLASQILDDMKGPLEFLPLRDEYAVRVKALVEAKIAGKDAPVVAKAMPTATATLQEQLAQSLALAKPKAKKAGLAPAPVAAHKKQKAS